MLFQGFSTYAKGEGFGGNPWRGHPLHAANNINGITVNPEHPDDGRIIHTLQLPHITRLQEQYLEKVIDTVGDLDNILYEIVNESGGYSVPWQYHLIDYLHDYEQRKGKSHPVGMTIPWEQSGAPSKNDILFRSPAEWISPIGEGGYKDDPPAADGSKVLLNDTDHLWGHGGTVAWVWKSFCRGMNTLLMYPYGSQYGLFDYPYCGILDMRDHPLWEPIILNMGYTRNYALRMNLNNCRPLKRGSSSHYCLGNPGREYLIFLPDGMRSRWIFSDAPATYTVEWFDPTSGITREAGHTDGKIKRWFISPFSAHSVLFLQKRDWRGYLQNDLNRHRCGSRGFERIKPV